MVENNDIEVKTPPQTGQGEAKKSAIDGLFAFYNRVRAFSNLAFYKMGHIEKTNMELGIRQMKAGNFFDAALRFKIVIWMNKSNVIAHYLLGKSFFYRGKFAEAIPHLKQALVLDPNLEEAKFILACCGQGADIKAIPRSFMIDKMDYIAGNYDQFVENTSSLVNKVLAEEFTRILGEKMAFNVLDLGCRGGDTSQMLRKRANSITGVEPCLKLVALARTRRVEDLLTFNLIVSKFPEDFLKDAQNTFPIVFSTYYLDNLGPLENYFGQVSKVVDKAGIFAFNVNRHTGPEDYFFKSAAMVFSHSPKYIEKLAAKYNFKIVAAREIVYTNGSTDVVYVLEKI